MNELDEFLNVHMKEAFLDPKVQAELKQLVTQRPEPFREVLETRELRMEGIKKNDAGEYQQNGSEVDPTVLKAALDRVNKMMLRESPALPEFQLRLDGEDLVPDAESYKRRAE